MTDKTKNINFPVLEMAMLGFSLAIICTIALFSYWNFQVIRNAEGQRNSSREIRHESLTLLSLLKDAETGQRGFLLTGKERYLEPYNIALLEIPKTLERLEALLDASSSHAQDLTRLKSLTGDKLNELETSLQLRREGKEAEVLALLDSDEGQRLLDEIRTISHQIEQNAQDQLGSSVIAQNESTSELRVVSLLGSALLFTFLVISAVVIFKGMKRRAFLHRESERAKNLLQTTLAGIADGVIATDAAGRINFINHCAQQLTGWNPEDAKGRPISEVFVIVNESTQDKVDNPLEKALAERMPMGLANHTNLISKDGTQSPIDDSTAPLFDEREQLIGGVLVFRDISRRRRSEQQLQEAAATLQRANEELQQFVNAAAHDLRSPLNTINGMAQVLSLQYKSQLGEKGDKILTHITRGVTRMAQLLDDLLAFAYASHFEHDGTLVPLDDVLAETLDNLRAEIERSSAIITSAPLPIVAARKTHMVQLFQNLIGNALKYRDGEPHIHVSADRANGEWAISVIDNGIGIDPAYSKQIFKPFSRLHAEEFPGTGIGLATCQKIVEGYGGRIWVESEPGRGSRFSFTLPQGEEQRVP
jgi:PAS domain S-box-containing protein